MNEIHANDTSDRLVRYYNYTDLDHRCRLLALTIQHTKREFDCLLAIAGDGLFVGHLLSQYLHIPKVWTIGIGKEADARSCLYVPNPLFFTTRNVLLVDLVSRTGKTLEQAASFLVQDTSVTRAVLFWLSLCYTGETPPEFYSEDIGEDMSFLFPWTKR